MEHNLFKEPVRILMGLGIPRDIETVFQAYTFLSERRSDPLDTDHILARKTCLAAINRSVDAETARAAFLRYAERHDMLAPDLDEAVTVRSDRIATDRLAS